MPDHDFKQNPMFLWRGRPSPEQYPPYDWSNLSGGGGGGVGGTDTGSACTWSRRLRWLRWDFDHNDLERSAGK